MTKLKAILLTSLIVMALVAIERQQAKAGQQDKKMDIVEQACVLLKHAIDHSNLELKNAKANGTDISQSYLDKRSHAIELYNNDCK